MPPDQLEETIADDEIRHSLRLTQDELDEVVATWSGTPTDLVVAGGVSLLFLVVGTIEVFPLGRVGIVVATLLGACAVCADLRRSTALAGRLAFASVGALGATGALGAAHAAGPAQMVPVWALLVGAGLLGALRARRWLRQRRAGRVELRGLLREVQRFNDAVALVHLQGDLAERGAARKPAPHVREAMLATRTKLVRALTVIGALRARRASLAAAPRKVLDALDASNAERLAQEAVLAVAARADELETLAAAQLELDRELEAPLPIEASSHARPDR